jgi:hypothetical protein
MAVSTALANSLLDAIVNNTSYALGNNPWVALHTGDPGTTGANEVTGGSYARQQVNFNAAASKAAKNAASFSFANMPAATVTHISLWSAETVGTFLIGGALSESIVVAGGGTATLSAEHLTASVTS